MGKGCSLGDRLTRSFTQAVYFALFTFDILAIQNTNLLTHRQLLHPVMITK